MAKEIAEEYASSLSDLTVNSKPLINMLTILAEENVDHAGVIVETVEKHLEKVHPEIKLPVLYLVDSIIKNVGGAYTQKFSASIVNMFTRTFKQVDEKTRAQMFKLRETWHDVFPATKMYQLDVKVNLIDPAWPIQAQPQPQPQQSNIHVNPNFVRKPGTNAAPTPAATPAPTLTSEEEEMRNILAKKEQELLMLQRKKIEMELEQTRRQLELAEKNAIKAVPMTAAPVVGFPPATPGVTPPAATTNLPGALDSHVPAKQRLGPPVNPGKGMGGRIAPVSGAMLAAARRDPRLARQHPPAAPSVPSAPAIAPNVFDIKPLDRVTKRKNVITIDVRPELTAAEPRRDPRRRDPRLDKQKKDIDERVRRERDRRSRNHEDRRKREEEKRKQEGEAKIDADSFDIAEPKPKEANDFLTKLQLPDPKKINKLPPIPKINREEKKEDAPSPIKKRKEVVRQERKPKKRDGSGKDSDSPSPDKRKALRERRAKKAADTEDKPDDDMVAFKELKNYHKERYMRRNREKSDSPEPAPAVPSGAPGAPAAPAEPPTNAEPATESKDVDLRVLPGVEVKAAQVNQKRTSTEALEGKPKKSKLDKFDILFGNEDVDLRQLPAVEEPTKPETKPDSPREKSPEGDSPKINEDSPASPEPEGSPKKDWHDVKDKEEARKKTPTKLDLVRAKLAEATKGKDRLGRPLMFTKSPSIEKERQRSPSTSEDTDLRPEADDEVNKETISLILTQAKEHYQDGKMDKNQYNTLMFQVMQLNEKLKLKEAKAKESLEISKRKLRAQGTVPSPKTSPGHNKFGDIDERVPPSFVDTPPNSQDVAMQDSDMRMGGRPYDPTDGPQPGLMRPHMPVPRFVGSYPPMWRGMRPRGDDYMPRGRGRGQGSFYRHRNPRPPYDSRYGGVQPKIGMYQGDSPIPRYRPTNVPPPLGTPGIFIPPTDYRALEYIDQDPMKTIDIDGIPREIRFYCDTAVIMLDWDDPREIKFLPGSRRLTFENKDSVVLNFNEGYKQVEFEDDVYDIKFGAPTRELFINKKWYECFFGAPPCVVLIDGKPRKIQLEGPPPQVDIGKAKRVDLCAGKINLIVDAQHMCPIFLDSKVQKFLIDGEHYTIRFADGLRTVLINEQPFQVEFGGLPRPIYIDERKHFIRFSVLPRHVLPGYANIYNMEGSVLTPEMHRDVKPAVSNNHVTKMEVDETQSPRPEAVASPDNDSQGGLDMLASVMPSSMAPASSFSGYSLADTFPKPEGIPGLEADKVIKEEIKKEGVVNLPGLGSLNVNDLFAKLVATGIVQVPQDKEEEQKAKEDKNTIHHVDLLKPKTLRVKQPGVVTRLYGGMQCSGCGTRFPPEQTTRYSAHLDWHFRQNRRLRDSARRAHSRHWHYDLADWVRYEEVEDAEEREKSWFETSGTEPAVRPPSPAAPPSVRAGAAPVDQHCALCGDRFPQYYHEDQEEWHLRGAVKKEDKNYHPQCWEDYQASLAKDESTPMDETFEMTAVDKIEDTVEIIEPEVEIDDGSDVELVVEKDEPAPPVEEIASIEEEEDDDDVVLKAEPVEQVLVNDDADTDDETRDEREKRDREFDFSKVKVKQEPVDPDDEPEITAEEEAVKTISDTTHTTFLSSLDGNVEEAPPVAAPVPAGGIRINISKAIPTLLSEGPVLDELSSVDDEPPPPGEEPTELEYTLKEAMQGIPFNRQPPLQRGQELSGLCSIM